MKPFGMSFEVEPGVRVEVDTDEHYKTKEPVVRLMVMRKVSEHGEEGRGVSMPPHVARQVAYALISAYEAARWPKKVEGTFVGDDAPCDPEKGCGTMPPGTRLHMEGGGPV